ncbi:host-nuclease inhibitor Gam family protein [Methylobacterium flocculans]|uniref:host-nuclease inhibitor Gam family protein n=1 Tax=Methylobacterium flocculans TaxID=2984843 RepID=UPI0021F3B550|nr:host-nuclease inhibitor Gam family protein [Methylobacterium sp. FF17]
MARAKTKGVDTNLPVPQSDAEAEQAIARLGVLQREDAIAKAHHDDQVAALEAERARQVKAFKEAETAIVLGLERWASVHRARLTNGGKTKTVQLPTGTLLWRDGRYAVKHGKLKIEDVVAAVRERRIEVTKLIALAKFDRRKDDAEQLVGVLAKLDTFLRMKVDLSKDAMLAARDVAETVPGVTVPRGPEEFAVEPLASQIREVA